MIRKFFVTSALSAGLLASALSFGHAQDAESVGTEAVEAVAEGTELTEAADVDAAEALAALEKAKNDAENWRKVDPERLIIFETTKGRVLIETFPEIAPKHVAQFTAITRSGDYDGTAFHRVIDGFMSQGGDIFALHTRDSGLPNIEAEFTFRRDPVEMPFDMIGDPNAAKDGYYKGLPVRTQSSWLAELSGDGRVESHVPHCQGVVSTARLGNDVNSGNSQFFLMRARSDHLNKEYSPWGRILQGQDAVLAMKTGDPQVVNPDILTAAMVVADMPEAERPQAWVQRTDGPEFQAQLGEMEDDVNVCDLPAVPTVVEG